MIADVIINEVESTFLPQVKLLPNLREVKQNLWRRLLRYCLILAASKLLRDEIREMYINET